MIELEIIKAFAQAGYQISGEAIEAILKSGNIHDSINRILRCVDESTIVIDTSHTTTLVERESEVEATPAHPYDPYTPPRPISEEELVNPQSVADEEDYCRIDILSDITNQSTCIGEYEEFVQYFRDRYSRLSEMLRRRMSSRPIESLKKQQRGDDREDVSIIGMVRDVRTTSNGHRLIELEDPTGSIPALILKKDEALYQLSSHILYDEVIGVTGSPTPDGNLFIVNSITWPDLPNPEYSFRRMESRKPGNRAVFISDVHVGSSTFLEDAWMRFIGWLRGEVDGDTLPSADNIRYLVIAGDLVDGIGVYPDQEKELKIDDIYAQYQQVAEYLKEVPGRINIIISPGNHDAVRQAEPQPRLPEEITRMFRGNTTFVGNPSMIGIDGVKVLVYHGRSIDDLVAALPGISYENPADAMREMLKRRHLSPIYGSRVSIAPEKRDHFVIEEIPDILHCGHVHTANTAVYRGVTLINSGTWQSQTEFQKRVNLQPHPGIATLVDLGTLQTQMIGFL
jgi:DNA polymerase II small subunit